MRGPLAAAAAANSTPRREGERARGPTPPTRRASVGMSVHVPQQLPAAELHAAPAAPPTDELPVLSQLAPAEAEAHAAQLAHATPAEVLGVAEAGSTQPVYQGQPLVTDAVPLGGGMPKATPSAKRPRTPKVAASVEANADGADPPLPKYRPPRKQKGAPGARAGGSALAGASGEPGGADTAAAAADEERPPVPHVINPAEWVLQIHPASQILFEKVLTHSDTNRLGRMVLPKTHAEAHFSLLDGQAGVPVVVADVYERAWTFKYRWWPNNNSKMYLLEGIQPFIRTAGLQAGDVFVFAVCPRGQFQVGGRKGSALKSAATAPRAPSVALSLARQQASAAAGGRAAANGLAPVRLAGSSAAATAAAAAAGAAGAAAGGQPGGRSRLGRRGRAQGPAELEPDLRGGRARHRRPGRHASQGRARAVWEPLLLRARRRGSSAHPQRRARAQGERGRVHVEPGGRGRGAQADGDALQAAAGAVGAADGGAVMAVTVSSVARVTNKYCTRTRAPLPYM